MWKVSQSLIVPPHTIAKRKRQLIEVPPGNHEIAVQLVPAYEQTRCLIRVRVPEPDSEPEIDAE